MKAVLRSTHFRTAGFTAATTFLEARNTREKGVVAALNFYVLTPICPVEARLFDCLLEVTTCLLRNLLLA